MLNKNSLRNKIEKLFSSNLIKQIGIVIAVTVACASIFFAGYFVNYFASSKQLRSIRFFLDAYEEYYYKQEDMNFVDVLVEGALDEYSEYFTKEEFQAYEQKGEGVRVGFGIGISGRKITKVLGNSPAEKIGLTAGGEVLAFKNFDSQEFTVCENDKQLNDFLNQANSLITLKVAYGEEIKEFSFGKEEYIENYVFYSDSTGNYRYVGNSEQMNLTKYTGEKLNLNEGWGYLRFTAFNGKADGTMGGVGQFAGALELFKQNGNSKIIIDLRSNGGGYLSILCDIASYLCNDQSGKSFVCQKKEYKNGNIVESYAPKSKYNNYGFEKIVILVNSTTASASEALVGAVLDYDKFSNANIARVIIDPLITEEGIEYRSFGKGILQSTCKNPLSGEVIKLTTAGVFWPLSNTSIHKTGINPTLDKRIIANTYGDAIAFAQTM